MILCKLDKCPYNRDGKFCERGYVAIDENGHCENVWRRGKIRNDFPQQKDMIEDKNHLKIFDIEYIEMTEEMEEESAKKRLIAERSKRKYGLIRKFFIPIWKEYQGQFGEEQDADRA